jgi:hypothetical protein
MRAMILMLCLAVVADIGIPISALAGDHVPCTTREDRQFKRLITTCTDGSRAVSRYDAQLKRWRTDVTTRGPGEKLRQWPNPQGYKR